MRIEDYPPQEPFSEVGRRYADETLKRSEGLAGIETAFGPDPHQGLLLFPADKPDGRVVVFWFGGGWTNGYKEEMAFYSRPLNAVGITFVSAGYRLAPAHVFPAGWHDAADAVAWAWHNIARFGGDPARLFLSGHSAGGHYAALLGVRRDWQAPRGLPEDVVRGVLPISGTYEFGSRSGLSMRPRFLGPPARQAEVEASPINYLHLPPPPLLLTHGARDFPHLIAQQERFADAARAAGGDVETLTVPDEDHFGVCYACGEAGSLWSARADDWTARRAGAAP